MLSRAILKMGLSSVTSNDYFIKKTSLMENSLFSIFHNINNLQRTLSTSRCIFCNVFQKQNTFQKNYHEVADHQYSGITENPRRQP